MDNLLQSILLVDDDDATIFYYRIIIEHAGFKVQVSVAKNGKIAMAYLDSAIAGKAPLPNLILLDINMPVMNGWDFMDVYRELPEECRSKMIVVMLTSSLNPDDVVRAGKYPDIKEFRIKPLSPEILNELRDRYFG
jgi:CheY-like chemotaxis protein